MGSFGIASGGRGTGFVFCDLRRIGFVLQNCSAVSFLDLDTRVAPPEDLPRQRFNMAGQEFSGIRGVYL
jgi:hypothetical protein